MSYVKTKWTDNQTPLSADNLNNIEDGIEAVPVDASEGRSSIVTKTVNIETDVDSHGNPIDRTNRVYGAFSSAFGSRNTVNDTATEGGVFGGKNTLYGEDAFVCGYQNTSYGNQSFTGGYNNTNRGKESFIFGNSNSFATNAQDSGIIGSTNTVGLTYHSFIVGKNHSVGDAVENTIISGYQSSVGDSVYGSAIFGNYNTVGSSSGYNGVFGSHNTISANATNSGVFGDSNSVGEGCQYNGVFGLTNTLNDGVSYAFVSGKNNTCSYGYSNLIGWGLKDTEEGQTIVGGYNKVISGAWFQVGTGSGNGSRKTSFAVFSDKVMMPTTTTIGEYGATTQYVQNIVGDINSVLDTINGTVI